MKNLILLISFTLYSIAISADTIQIADLGGKITSSNTDLENRNVDLSSSSFLSIVSIARSLDKNINKESLIKYYNLSIFNGNFNPKIFIKLVVDNKTQLVN